LSSGISTLKPKINKDPLNHFKERGVQNVLIMMRKCIKVKIGDENMGAGNL